VITLVISHNTATVKYHRHKPLAYFQIYYKGCMCMHINCSFSQAWI